MWVLTSLEFLVEEGMTWELSVEQRLKFSELLNSMGVRDVWLAHAIADRVSSCGIPCSLDESGTSLLIDTEIVESIQLGMGEPGIYAPHVLDAVIKVLGLNLQSELSGSGFRFRDLLTQLAMHWQIDKDYT